jgi:hypothetical protein
MKRLQNWKRALGIYLLWATAHLLIFWLKTPIYNPKQGFWPFWTHETSNNWSWDLGQYDATELGIYLVIPVVLYISLTLIFSKQK